MVLEKPISQKRAAPIKNSDPKKSGVLYFIVIWRRLKYYYIPEKQGTKLKSEILIFVVISTCSGMRTKDKLFRCLVALHML